MVVATSNVAPDDLYRDGLNWGLFEPFIAILKRHSEIVALRWRHRLSPVEARGTAGLCDAACEKARQVMDAAWDAAVSGHEENSRVVEVKGRKIHIPRANGRGSPASVSRNCAPGRWLRVTIWLSPRPSTPSSSMTFPSCSLISATKPSA